LEFPGSQNKLPDVIEKFYSAVTRIKENEPKGYVTMFFFLHRMYTSLLVCCITFLHGLCFILY
jgi:hypothetical protein